MGTMSDGRKFVMMLAFLGLFGIAMVAYVISRSFVSPPADLSMMDTLDRDIKILVDKDRLTYLERIEIERLEKKRHDLVAGKLEFERIMGK